MSLTPNNHAFVHCAVPWAGAKTNPFFSTFVSHRTSRPSVYISKRPRQSLIQATAASNGISKAKQVEHIPTVPSTKSKKPSHLVRFLRLVFSEWTIFPALLAAIVGSVCSVTQPLFFGRIVGTLSRAELTPFPGMQRQLLNRIGVLGCLYAVEITCTICFVLLVSRLAEKVTRKLRESVFANVFQNDIGFFDRFGRTNIENSLTSEIAAVRNGLWNNLSRDRGIRACCDVILGVFLNLFNTGSIGTPIFGVLVPIMATIVAQIGLRNGRMAARMSAKDSALQEFLNDRLRGVRTLKAFGAEAREQRALRALLDSAQGTAVTKSKSQAFTEAASRVSIYVTVLSFFISGGLLICAGKLTYESFACLTGFVWILNFAVQGMTYSLTDAGKISASLRKIYELNDNAEAYSRSLTKHVEPLNGIPAFSGHVRFANVSFHYPGRPDVTVLNGIDFSIHPGQMVALVGDSGGGKSSIAGLLSRFYAPTSGSISIDGRDIQTLPSDVFSQQISLVDQDPVLFTGTIRENIAYGLPDVDVSDEQIISAAKEANAHDFIMNLTDGYDTVWSLGSNLSGGQRQRIAIARSLVKSPRILVLDEATSALDQDSERLVQRALERVMKNRTVLIIAHRLSTVRTADVILFVKGGRIIERGTYDDLIAIPDGNFRALVESANTAQSMTEASF